MSPWTEDDCDRADIARDEWKDEKVQQAARLRRNCPRCDYDLAGDIGASNHNQSERLRWMTQGEDEGLGLTSTKAAYWEARCRKAEDANRSKKPLHPQFAEWCDMQVEEEDASG